MLSLTQNVRNLPSEAQRTWQEEEEQKDCFEPEDGEGRYIALSMTWSL